MANEVRIRVTDENKTGPGTRAAEENVRKVANTVEAASKKVAKARDDEANAAGRVRVAELRLNELRESGKAKASAMAAAEESLANAHRGLAAAQAEAAKSAQDLAAARAKATGGETGGGDEVEKELASAKQRIDKFKGQLAGELKSAGMTAGAALAGALGAGISTVAAAGLFIGIAAAAQSSNAQVAEAYGDLWAQVKAGAQETSGMLAGEFIDGAERLGRTFNDLKPELADAFASAQPAVDDLFSGVDRGVRAVMPGLVTAAKASSQATDGFADALESAGRGVGNFFTEASEGADAGGDAFREFGQIVERMGSFAGRILATLANSGQIWFPALTSAVDSTATAVENLATTALPSLAGGAAMGLNAFSLLMNLANGLISVLGPLAPMLINVATALKLVDMVSFGGVSRSWDTFKTSIGDAPNLTSKVKVGFTGLLTTLGPVGLAAGAFALGLDALGASQQRAAERQHALNNAFRESKGAIDANVRATVAKNLADDGLLQKGKDIGVSASLMTDAWLGNASAVDHVKEAVARYTKELEGQGQMEGQVAQGSDALSTKAHEVGMAMNDQSSEVSEAARKGKLYAEATDGVAGASDKAAGAIGRQKLSLQELRAVLDEMISKDLAFRNAVDATEEAQAGAAEALKEHGAKSEEYTDAVRGVEGAMISQAQAARDLAIANSIATSDAGKAADGQKRYAQEIVAMASAAGNNAPLALRQMLGSLSDTDLAAQGATRSIDGAGNAVYRLPGGKEIKVAAIDDATWRAERINAAIQAIRDKFVTVTTNFVTTGFGTAGSAAGSRPMSQGRAHGGVVGAIGHAAEGGPRGPVVNVNERGQETARMPDGNLMMLPMGSTVNTHEDSQRMLDMRGGASDVRVTFDFTGIEGPAGRLLMEMMRSGIRVRGGNVQKVLGS